MLLSNASLLMEALHMVILDGKSIIQHSILLVALILAICRYPSERLTRKQALKGMTLDAAYASFQEDEIGSLQVGKKADLVVFDRNFVECEDEEVCDGSEILEARVKAVVIDGMVVWGKLLRSETWKVVHELFGRLITRAISSATPL